MGFGGECGNSRAPRADGTHAWVWDHRFEQLARMERDLIAHTTALGTADAAKWVNRQEFDAAARDDQHGYVDKSLREVGHGICRAVSGAPPETPKSGGWIIFHGFGFLSC